MAVITDDPTSKKAFKDVLDHEADDPMDQCYVKDIQRLGYLDDDAGPDRMLDDEEAPRLGILSHCNTMQKAIYPITVHRRTADGTPQTQHLLLVYFNESDLSYESVHIAIKQYLIDIEHRFTYDDYIIVDLPIARVSPTSTIGIIDENYGLYDINKLQFLFKDSEFSHQETHRDQITSI